MPNRKQPDWPRANPEDLANFDPSTKVCVMNCGPSTTDPRSKAERRFLCTDCEVRTPMNDERRPLSPLERDAIPSFYVSRGNDLPPCTHRMAKSDIPVWCQSGDDAWALMEIIRPLFDEGEKTVPMPTTVAQARGMALLGTAWLQANAPSELKSIRSGVPEGFVKKHKLDLVVAEAKRVEAMQAETIQRLSDDLRTAYMHQESNEMDPIWYWQGDGHDYPESLASDAVVIIRADQLRTLLAGQKPQEAE